MLRKLSECCNCSASLLLQASILTFQVYLDSAEIFNLDIVCMGGVQLQA